MINSGTREKSTQVTRDMRTKSESSINFISEFNTRDIKHSILPEELRTQLPHTESMCGRWHIGQGLRKDHRIFCGKKLRKLFAHPSLNLGVKFFQFAFCLVSQLENTDHTYNEYTRPALMSRNARSYSRFTSVLYSGVKGHFSSSASIVLPRETDSYSSSESFSNIFSSIRQISSQNAMRSNKNHDGFPSMSNPATARNSFGSFKSPETALEKCSTRGLAGTMTADFTPDIFADFLFMTGSIACSLLGQQGGVEIISAQFC